MRAKAFAVCILALILSACAPPQVTAIGDPTQGSVSRTPSVGLVLIQRVSIVDTESGALTGPRDVLISRDGKIAAVAPGRTIPVSAAERRVDGRGKFLMAGLIDVHAHIADGGILPPSDERRARALRQFLRYGVTTIFVPGATGAGDAEWPTVRARCRDRAAICPDLHGSGSLITARGSHPVSTIFSMPFDVPVAALDGRGVTMLEANSDIPALIARKQAIGADAVKIVIEDGPPPWYPKPRLADARVGEITAASHARSMPVFAHVSMASHVEVALDHGVDGIMHAPTDPLSDATLRRMADRRMWFVSTFSLYDGILTWARRAREADPYAIKGVHAAVLDSLAAPPFLAAAAESEADALRYIANGSSNIRRAVAAGVPIALGTDVNNPFVYPGYSAHEELAMMVRAGLSPAQALRAATLGGAAFVGRAATLGRIAPGYEADLILLARNPLDGIENSRAIEAVFADGIEIADPVTMLN